MEPLDEKSVAFFRDRRSCLVGAGAADPAAAARAILGAQAQQEGPALFALAQRTRGRPTAARLRGLLLREDRRSLVRTWGQRDTLHVFAPEDWPLVVAARGEWPQSGRRGAMPTEPDVGVARKKFESAAAPIGRSELFEILPKRFVQEVASHPGIASAGGSPERFAAARLIWRLALAGDICFAHKRGAEQTYAHRRLWFPTLDWGPAADAEAAATALAKRYLAVHGPARAQDLAHFFGATVTKARIWLERLEPETAIVQCGDRDDLFCLKQDLKQLRKAAPKSARDWPVRFLPKWDTHLMRHQDKSWLLSEEEERPIVWRRGADIAASVVARGRIVATWSHRATKKKVKVEVVPLSGWRKSFEAGAKAEASHLAKHLGVPESEVQFDNG